MTEDRERYVGEGEPANDDDLYLPEGVDRTFAEHLAEQLDALYPAAEDGGNRYLATKHLVWQAMATMMRKGVPPPHASQSIVAVVMEMLLEGLGPAAAADHLHRMADNLAAMKPN